MSELFIMFWLHGAIFVYILIFMKQHFPLVRIWWQFICDTSRIAESLYRSHTSLVLIMMGYTRVITASFWQCWYNLYADCHKRDLCHEGGPVDDFFGDNPWVSQDLLSLMPSLSQTFCDSYGIPKLSRFISGALRWHNQDVWHHWLATRPLLYLIYYQI